VRKYKQLSVEKRNLNLDFVYNLQIIITSNILLEIKTVKIRI